MNACMRSCLLFITKVVFITKFVPNNNNSLSIVARDFTGSVVQRTDNFYKPSFEVDTRGWAWTKDGI